MRKKLFFAAVFLAGLARLAPAQTPDLVLNPGSSYVDVGRGIPWGASFNRTYVLVPKSPNTSICLYVVNNNPTNSHGFTVTASQTGDSQVADFSNNQARFNPALSINLPTSAPFSSMVSGFIQSTAAAKIAIRFSGSGFAGGTPDTADVFLVQTTAGTCGSSSTALLVQGPTAPGGTLLLNPFPIAGVDLSNIVRTITAEVAGSDGSRNLQVAKNSSSVGTDLGGTSVMANGALAANVYAPDAGQIANHTINSSLNTTPATGPLGAPGRALLTHNSGYTGSDSRLIGSAGTTNISLNIPNGQSTAPKFVGTNLACEFSLISTGGTGTTPTLDVFIQDSDDNVNFDDRIHFNQVTTAASTQRAGIFALAHLAPAAYTAGTLAAGSSIDGPIKANLRVSYVAGGTTPNFSSVAVTVTCN